MKPRLSVREDARAVEMSFRDAWSLMLALPRRRDPPRGMLPVQPSYPVVELRNLDYVPEIHEERRCSQCRTNE